MQKQVIKFTNRSPYPNSIFIGNEDDNLARQVQFVLPSEIDGAKIYLHLSIGEYSDVIELDDSLIYVPTRTHTQYPGNWTGYLEAHAGNDTVWHSNTFTFKVGDLPDSGEQIEQAYPSAIESALNEIRSLSEKTEDNAAQVSKDKQTVEQKVSDINASTSKINIVAQTLEPGTTATADASISPKDGIQLNVGIPGGLPGRDGRDGVDGKDGYTPVKGVDYFDGANGLNAPQIDDTQASEEHPWSGAKVDAELSELKDDLSNKLTKSPADWEPWTADEQAAARAKAGMVTDTPFELVGDVTTEEAVQSIVLMLSKPCRYISITFEIPTESVGASRNVYFSATDKMIVSECFHRSETSKTSEINRAIYKSTAEIVGGEIISYGGISAGTSMTVDYMNRPIYGVLAGYGGIKADSFTKICVFTYGTAFPAGSSVKIYGC